MARIRRKVRGRVRDADGRTLFDDVALLEVEGGVLIVGTATAYPDAPPLPKTRLRIVADVAAARLRPSGRDRTAYSDLDGNVFDVEPFDGCAFRCGSPYRSIGSTVAV